MDIQEYISSGILELYVYGSLSEPESREVTRMVRDYPEVKAEVEKIEAALQSLSAAAAPSDPKPLLAPSPVDGAGGKEVVKMAQSKTNWLSIFRMGSKLPFFNRSFCSI
ncbi:hypothetical protein [Antarcticibacterium sp. 1MA-6-2]|uniref:hypothetical protein n=1 Tax=Antarcticibacterium sp. 1MA-6-2 TaxID=2908210 RepID=UPI002882E178|nr:hypothetical protein [Antarcticibacterium sp. 1MA-6-2]